MAGYAANRNRVSGVSIEIFIHVDEVNGTPLELLSTEYIGQDQLLQDVVDCEARYQRILTHQLEPVQCVLQQGNCRHQISHLVKCCPPVAVLCWGQRGTGPPNFFQGNLGLTFPLGHSSSATG